MQTPTKLAVLKKWVRWRWHPGSPAAPSPVSPPAASREAHRAHSILVYGICQATHLGRILNAIPSIVNRFNISAIEMCADPVTGEFRRPPPEILETCECLYFQAHLGEVLPDYLQRLIAQGRSQRFPILTCHPLWPSHTELYRMLVQTLDAQEMQRARRLLQEPGLPWGRFPYADRVLLDLAKTEEVDERIVDRYVALDLAKTIDLDRRVQLWRRHLEEVDQGCDVRLAELQWREWRDTRHYWAINHPANQLFGEILRRLFACTVGPIPEEEVVEALRTSEPNHFMPPVHPSVARYLGLKWYSPDELFNWPDGPFTLRQWALEHVRYTRRILACRPLLDANSQPQD
ncbi:MAG TPA: WcbI family polysaccharide biosynthesis putative acetyltransferase [Bryobacteraceae bacterium]|nr:WcbI family polysaccharide biosynthesis putative acetyltransferase [Bryobacteraceae bacterium]